MRTSDNFVFGHPLIGDRSEDSERLERLGIEEDVVDHPAEVVSVVRERHQLVRHRRRQLKINNKFDQVKLSTYLSHKINNKFFKSNFQLADNINNKIFINN